MQKYCVETPMRVALALDDDPVRMAQDFTE